MKIVYNDDSKKVKIHRPKPLSQLYIKNVNNKFVSTIVRNPYSYFKSVDYRRKLRNTNIHILNEKMGKLKTDIYHPKRKLKEKNGFSL
jgi:hypothetical protein